MITTADWLRYVDSLGPSDANSMRMRLQAAGADPARADWLVKLVWRRQVARAAARIAFPVVIFGFVWSMYQWWLAWNGDPRGPSIIDVIYPTAIVALGGVALIISSAVELSPQIDLRSHDSIPEELAPPPRQVAVASARSGAASRLIIGVICVLMIPLSAAAPTTRKRVLLKNGGVETTGRVTELYTTRGSKGSTNDHIRYTFDRGAGSRIVRRSEYSRYHVGDTVPVTYLPDQPEINDARSKEQLRSSNFEDPIWIIILVYGGVVFPLTILILRISVSMQRNLAERGVAAIAEVTRAGPQSVTYRFGDNTGRWFWGKRSVRQRASVGQPIVILYDPDKPNKSIPLGALSDIEFG